MWLDTERYEDQNWGGVMLYEHKWRRKEYREKKHKTGEFGEWKLVAPTPNTEKAAEVEFWWSDFCTPSVGFNNQLFTKLVVAKLNFRLIIKITNEKYRNFHDVPNMLEYKVGAN